MICRFAVAVFEVFDVIEDAGVITAVNRFIGVERTFMWCGFISVLLNHFLGLRLSIPTDEVAEVKAAHAGTFKLNI